MHYSWAMDLDPKGANSQIKDVLDPTLNRATQEEAMAAVAADLGVANTTAASTADTTAGGGAAGASGEISIDNAMDTANSSSSSSSSSNDSDLMLGRVPPGAEGVEGSPNLSDNDDDDDADEHMQTGNGRNDPFVSFPPSSQRDESFSDTSHDVSSFNPPADGASTSQEESLLESSSAAACPPSASTAAAARTRRGRSSSSFEVESTAAALLALRGQGHVEDEDMAQDLEVTPPINIAGHSSDESL